MYYTVSCDVSGASVFWMHNKSRIMLLPFMLFLKSDSSPVGALKPHQLQMFPKLNSFTVCITLQVQSTVKGGKYIGNYIPPI